MRKMTEKAMRSTNGGFWENGRYYRIVWGCDSCRKYGHVGNWLTLQAARSHQGHGGYHEMICY